MDAGTSCAAANYRLCVVGRDAHIAPPGLREFFRCVGGPMWASAPTKAFTPNGCVYPKGTCSASFHSAAVRRAFGSKIARFCASLFSLVFPPGGKATADMALGLVFLQQRLYLQPQRPVVQRQPLADILMDGGFADTEFFGSVPHCRPVLYQVKSQFFGPLLQILFDSAPLLQAVPLYEPERGKRTENPQAQGRNKKLNNCSESKSGLIGRGWRRSGP